MAIIYLVNQKTRMCQILSGSEKNEEHLRNLDQAKKGGFVEVTPEQQENFRAETRKALSAGWNPDGGISYEKFMAKMADASEKK